MASPHPCKDTPEALLTKYSLAVWYEQGGAGRILSQTDLSFVLSFVLR